MTAIVVRRRRQKQVEFDQRAVHAELERVRQSFARHVAEMSAEDLRRTSNGTRWSNRQLLFHMLFGYMLVLTLLRMAKVLGRCPRWLTKPFAAFLNSLTTPFHWVNYLGSVGGGSVLTPQHMQRRLERVTEKLERDLERQSAEQLARGMHYPTRWDPYFKEYMTLADIYHYPTQHYDHHERQLSA